MSKGCLPKVRIGGYWNGYMATHQVNLDAIIQREDFESGSQAKGELKETRFNVPQLMRGEYIFDALRKPAFQRETSNWSPRVIVEFIQSFLDGDLIPAVIVWKSQYTHRLFLIDGSHRVSALAAWINDDYGDGPISREFWGTITPQQARFHRQTQELVLKEIGTYESLKGIVPSSASEQMKRRLSNLNTRPIPLQPVDGDSDVAEKSFLTINRNPALVDLNELAIIEARAKPNALATRALMRAGTGYPYWGKLPRAHEITKTARETYDLLFGQIVEIGTKVADVPRAGQPYSAEAFTMLLDMVNIFNDVKDASWKKPKTGLTSSKSKQPITPELPDDQDGSATLTYIERIRDLARLVASPENRYAGMGLDQVVYSYGPTGAFYPTAFIASLKFASEMTDKERYEFLKIRYHFEEFLVAYKSFMKDLGHSKGGRLRPLAAFLRMYKVIIECLEKQGNMDYVAIAGILLKNPDLKGLNEPSQQVINRVTGKRFSKSAIAAAAVREALNTHGRCNICGARLPYYARSQDHIIDKSKGGTGSADNLQYTHAYCNSVKTKLETEGWVFTKP